MGHRAIPCQSGRPNLDQQPYPGKTLGFTQSAWTSKDGPTGPLKTLLESHGISVVPGVNTPPPGSLNASQAAARGLNLQQANNLNGSLARDAIANRFSAQGLPTQTEVPRLGGQRIVDVVADVPANDPRYATRIETESKVGRTGATSGSSGTRAQAAKDAAQLLDNRSVRAGGELLAKAGRVVRPIGIALDALNVAQAFRDDGNRIGENTGRAASGLVGGAAGAWGGAAAGARHWLRGARRGHPGWRHHRRHHRWFGRRRCRERPVRRDQKPVLRTCRVAFDVSGRERGWPAPCPALWT